MEAGLPACWLLLELEKPASRQPGSKYYRVRDNGTFQTMVKIKDRNHHRLGSAGTGSFCSSAPLRSQ